MRGKQYNRKLSLRVQNLTRVIVRYTDASYRRATLTQVSNSNKQSATIISPES